MKKIIFIVLLTTQVFFAQNAFETGNDLYKKGQYNEAIVAYQNVLKSKKQSAELYFNLANCYYKLNKVAPAIYNYEKALLLNPNDQEIKNNLQFAQKLQIDEIKVIPKVGFAKVLQNITSTFHYNTWGWVSIGFAFLFLFFFLGYYFSETTLSKRIFFIGMFVFIFGLVISFAAAVFEKNTYNNERPAIVFAEVVSVKSEPKAPSSEVVVVHEGTKVFVQESSDNWKKIQLTDETTGWIEESAIKEIK